MSARSKAKKDQTPGHKCAGARLYVSVHCECGWTSGKWGGADRRSAYAEWRWHVEQCAKTADNVSAREA